LPVGAATVAVFVSLAVIAELFHVNLYSENTVSVSVTLAFASALVAGVPGVAAVSAGIALTHYFKVRPPVYRVAFNWATHVLAGSIPAIVAQMQPAVLDVFSLPVITALAIGMGVAYYAVDTGLIAVAIALSRREGVRAIWLRQFRWLAVHYVSLCVMALFVAIAHRYLGFPGLAVFMLPPFLLRYAQKQYVERTENSVRELQRMNRELTRANREIGDASRSMRRLNDELFLTLSKIIDARDAFASGHAAQVAKFAVAIASELGLPAERWEPLRQTALLHDVGKLGIPERILHKPGRLTDEEYSLVRTHVSLGAEFLETCQGLRHLASFVKHHHERWDGSGYPDRLRGDQIPIESRILAVCDAVEAMASDRPYHRAMPLDDVIAELRRCSGTQFDPAVVEAFVRAVRRHGAQFVVNSAAEVSRLQAGQVDRMRRRMGQPAGTPHPAPTHSISD
jgi:putative nucleotidyltransferase with HDIG domain